MLEDALVEWSVFFEWFWPGFGIRLEVRVWVRLMQVLSVFCCEAWPGNWF